MGGLIVRLLVRLMAGDQLTDDAYIFFRYATNAAAGDGLVYNVGEEVYGFTSPLYTGLLVPLAAATGTSALPGAAVVFGLAAWIGFALVVGRLAQRTMPMPWLTATIVAGYFSLVLGSINGMETGLFLLLQYLAVYLLVTDRGNRGIAVAGLLALTRPEGLVFLALALAALAVRRRQPFPWAGTVIGAGLVVVWTAAAGLLYGSFLPQSLLAKSGAVDSGVSGLSGAFRTLGMLAFGLSSSQFKTLGSMQAVIVVGAVALLGLVVRDGVELWRRRSPEVVIPAFFVCIWLGYVVAQPVNIWSWYTAPTSAACLWCVTRQVGHLLPNLSLPRWDGRRWQAAACGVAGIVLVGGLVFASGRRTDNLRLVVDNLDRAAATVAIERPGAESVMLGDIGVVGYRLDDTRIIDLSGLVTTRGAGTASDGRLHSLGRLIQEAEPDAVILSEDPRGRDETVTGSLRRPAFADDAEQQWFEQHYELISRPESERRADRGRWIWIQRAPAD